MASAPLSFKPWSLRANNDTSLQEVLARVSHERGHFRDITEASLREEIANGSSTSSSASSSDDEDDDDPATQHGRAKATTRQELFAARAEMLSQVQHAQNEILLALDFVSLLESSHAPQQAGTTASQALKAVVPLGTLGTDFWHRMPENKAREAQDNLLATQVRMQSLQESADDLLAAALRLEDNVRTETVFWDQVLAISDRGWSVSRIPRAQGMLGVHFGCNGSVGEFARRDLAALMPGEDGGIVLERGLGTKPKGIKVVVRKKGRLVGSSRLPTMPDEDETTLEARIRHARDSLYDEELFHEMIRESRTLKSMGVEMVGSTLSFTAGQNDADPRIELELVSLDDAQELEADALHGSDNLAQATLLAARLLLGQAHRQKVKQKTIPPPPMSDKKDEVPVLSIIRPILLLLYHHGFCQRLNNYASSIESLLGNADIDATVEPANFNFPLPDDLMSTTSEAIIEAILLRPLTARASITIPTPGNEDNFQLDLSIQTSSTMLSGSTFGIRVPKSSSLKVPESFSLSAIEDLFSTADEMLGTQIIEALFPNADPAKGWVLEKGEGRMWRSVDQEEDGEREELMLEISGEAGEMDLVVVDRGGSEKRNGNWKVERVNDGGEDPSLWSIWTEVVGVANAGEDEVLQANVD